MNARRLFPLFLLPLAAAASLARAESSVPGYVCDVARNGEALSTFVVAGDGYGDVDVAGTPVYCDLAAGYNTSEPMHCGILHLPEDDDASPAREALVFFYYDVSKFEIRLPIAGDARYTLTCESQI